MHLQERKEARKEGRKEIKLIAKKTTHLQYLGNTVQKKTKKRNYVQINSKFLQKITFSR